MLCLRCCVDGSELDNWRFLIPIKSLRCNPIPMDTLVHTTNPPKPQSPGVDYYFFLSIRILSFHIDLGLHQEISNLTKMLHRPIFMSGAILALSTNVWAHAAINQALGVKSTAAQSDVQRPSSNKPCGNAALASIDSSTAVKADNTGSFTVDVQNFNAQVLFSPPDRSMLTCLFSGKDVSRQVSMQVDAAGTGANFVAGKVTTNGQAAPATTGTEKITAALPAGTKCTGGASGNLCLASFKTAGSFGNYVVVPQSAGGAAAAAAATENTATGTFPSTAINVCRHLDIPTSSQTASQAAKAQSTMHRMLPQAPVGTLWQHPTNIDMQTYHAS